MFNKLVYNGLCDKDDSVSILKPFLKSVSYRKSTRSTPIKVGRFVIIYINEVPRKAERFNTKNQNIISDEEPIL
jgi:hypothetical protein